LPAPDFIVRWEEFQIVCADLRLKHESAAPVDQIHSPPKSLRAVLSCSDKHADELIQALVTGQISPGKEGHVRSAIEDLSAGNRAALIEQIASLSANKEKVRVGAERLRTNFRSAK
jgi:hypothetical protein